MDKMFLEITDDIITTIRIIPTFYKTVQIRGFLSILPFNI